MDKHPSSLYETTAADPIPVPQSGIKIALEKAVNGIIIVDRPDSITLANPGAERRPGFEPKGGRASWPFSKGNCRLTRQLQVLR